MRITFKEHPPIHNAEIVFDSLNNLHRHAKISNLHKQFSLLMTQMVIREKSNKVNDVKNLIVIIIVAEVATKILRWKAQRFGHNARKQNIMKNHEKLRKTETKNGKNIHFKYCMSVKTPLITKSLNFASLWLVFTL